MKKLLINTFLRPAGLVDVFSENGNGTILEDKQFFYKDLDGNIIGSYRLNTPFNPDDLFYYKELYQLLNDDRVFIIDPVDYEDSLSVELPLKRVTESDILISNSLILNTTYYLKKGNDIDGPFYINNKTTKQNLKQKATNKLMFVLDSEKGVLTVLNPAEAV